MEYWNCFKRHYFLFRCHESYKILVNVVFKSHNNCCISQKYHFSLLIFVLDKKFPSLFSFNVWALCPTGYYMNGLRLGAGPPAYLLHIDEAQCCHPQGHPNSYEDCYDQDVTISFDNKGWSECQRAGYFMTGFYKSGCNDIYCIEKFKCCKMEKRNVDFINFNHELAILKITTHTENLHFNISFPTLLPVRQLTIYNQCFKTSLVPKKLIQTNQTLPTSLKHISFYSGYQWRMERLWRLERV